MAKKKAPPKKKATSAETDKRLKQMRAIATRWVNYSFDAEDYWNVDEKEDLRTGAIVHDETPGYRGLNNSSKESVLLRAAAYQLGHPGESAKELAAEAKNWVKLTQIATPVLLWNNSCGAFLAGIKEAREAAGLSRLMNLRITMRGAEVHCPFDALHKSPDRYELVIRDKKTGEAVVTATTYEVNEYY